MNKVKTMQEAYRVFELLGIKEVTKKWQKKQGTEVWELPQKTMYYNGHASINRFSIYRSGYVRKMIVWGENNASKSCYQLNRTRKSDEYFKDYDCNGSWTGKYRKSNRTERIMIDTHRDRIVYLCNYILKNYYKGGKMNLVGEYTMKRVAEVHGEWWKANRNSYDLPFEETVERDSWIDDNDVKVIINGHRYNLS
jgi:hypothetical protein